MAGGGGGRGGGGGARAEGAVRNWQVFAGRNRFWCDGRLMTAPRPGVLLLTLSLLLGTATAHFVLDCPFLAARVSPLLPAVGGALFALTLAALLRTALSDPGVLPRATPPEAAAAAAAAANGAGPGSAAADAARPPPRARDVLVNGTPVKLKYCFTCKMFRPPRASHCSLCDNCVDRFDHHCPWVGNCVGRRNYRYFYTFVVSLAFLAVFVFACAVTHLALLARGASAAAAGAGAGAGASEGAGLAAALRASPGSAVVAAVCFLSVWSVLGLAGFHTYLAATDQTTNEDIKGAFSRGRSANPYSRGSACANCWHVLCGPMPPSLIARRQRHVACDLPPGFGVKLQPPAPPPPPPVLLPPAGSPRHAYMNHSLDLDPVPLHADALPLRAVPPLHPPPPPLSASRLRMLHRTTMIDAALDLDEPAPLPPLPPLPAL